MLLELPVLLVLLALLVPVVLVVLVEIEHITTGGGTARHHSQPLLASAQVLPCLAGLLLEVPPTQMRRFLSLRRQSPEAPGQVKLDHRGPAGWLSIPAHLPAMLSLAASSPATFSSIPPCPQEDSQLAASSGKTSSTGNGAAGGDGVAVAGASTLSGIGCHLRGKHQAS